MDRCCVKAELLFLLLLFISRIDRALRQEGFAGGTCGGQSARSGFGPPHLGSEENPRSEQQGSGLHVSSLTARLLHR